MASKKALGTLPQHVASGSLCYWSKTYYDVGYKSTMSTDRSQPSKEPIFVLTTTVAKAAIRTNK